MTDTSMIARYIPDEERRARVVALEQALAPGPFGFNRYPYSPSDYITDLQGILDVVDAYVAENPPAPPASPAPPAPDAALSDLRERMTRAIKTLGDLADVENPGSARRAHLASKINGVALALSYLDEAIRFAKAS